MRGYFRRNLAVLMLSIIFVLYLFPLTALAAGPEIHPPKITPPDIHAPTYTPPNVKSPEVKRPDTHPQDPSHGAQDQTHGDGANPSLPPNVTPWSILKVVLKNGFGGFLDFVDKLIIKDREGGKITPEYVKGGFSKWFFDGFLRNAAVNLLYPKDSYQYLLNSIYDSYKRIKDVGSYFESPKEMLQAIKVYKKFGGYKAIKNFSGLKNGAIMEFLNAITKAPKPLSKLTPALSVINGTISTIDMCTNLYEWGHTGNASKGWSALASFGDVLSSAAPWVAMACPPAAAVMFGLGTVLWAVGTYKANAANFKKGVAKGLQKLKEVGESFANGVKHAVSSVGRFVKGLFG